MARPNAVFDGDQIALCGWRTRSNVLKQPGFLKHAVLRSTPRSLAISVSLSYALLGAMYIAMPIIIVDKRDLSSFHEFRRWLDAGGVVFAWIAVVAAINFAMAAASFRFHLKGANFRRAALVGALLLLCDRVLHAVSVYRAAVHDTLSVPIDSTTILATNLAMVVAYGVLSYVLIRIHLRVAETRT